MSTQDEPTLSDDLENAFDEAESPEPEVIEEVVEEVEEEVVEPELEAFTPPNSWKKDYHDFFAGADRNLQEYILERESQFERGIGEKGQQLSQTRQQLEAMQSALTPLQQSWQMQGMDVNAGLQSLVGYAQALQSNPQETLLALAKQYGVDLQQAFDEQPYIDPALKQYEDKIATLEQKLHSFEHNTQTQQQNAAFSQLDQFEQATDAEGNLKHPHFDQVMDQMTGLLQAGIAQDLESAYEKAVLLNPDVQADLSAQKAQAQAHAKQQQAEKAKLATKQSVSSTETTEINDSDLSLNDALSKEWDRMANA